MCLEKQNTLLYYKRLQTLLILDDTIQNADYLSPITQMHLMYMRLECPHSSSLTGSEKPQHVSSIFFHLSLHIVQQVLLPHILKVSDKILYNIGQNPQIIPKQELNITGDGFTNSSYVPLVVSV